jgi:hypothetical protein
VSNTIPLSPEEYSGPAPPDEGWNNSKPEISASRLIKGATYRNASTVCLMPTRGVDEALHYKVADGFKALMAPMNHGFYPIRLAGMEVADAYNQGVQMVLDNPDLAKFKFILTYESDNVPPPDGLIKLVESIYGSPYAGVGGLYWTKGEHGMPMIYGDPKDPAINWRPMVPEPEALQECRGLAMGFTLWDMEIFKDKRLGPPWFETIQKHVPWQGSASGTQDLRWCEKAGSLGYRFAVDTRVRVGHVQFEKSPTHPAGFVW